MKPRASFWNELTIFMEAYTESFESKDQTIDKIGSELGLTETMIQEVQQGTETPDKVVMNIWRKLCPTEADRI